MGVEDTMQLVESFTGFKSKEVRPWTNHRLMDFNSLDPGR